MGWHSSWDFSTGQQYRGFLYERLGDLYAAWNERQLLWDVVWNFPTHVPLVQPESWRDSSPQGPYYQLTYLKSVVKGMIEDNYLTHGWVNEAELAKVGTLKQWMDANTVIIASTYGGNNVPVFYNVTAIPTDGGNGGAGTLAKLLTDLGLPSNYFYYTPYRPWHEPCGITNSAEVEAGFNLWDYGEYGLYLIIKNMKRFVEINADIRWTPYVVRDWTHASADGRDSAGTAGDIDSYADSLVRTATNYPLYANATRLPYTYAYGRRSRGATYTGYVWYSYATRTGQSYIPTTYYGSHAVGYPITINSYPILYAMGDSAENYWKSYGTHGPFYCTGEYNWTYQASETGYTTDEWTILTPNTVNVNGVDVTVNSPAIGGSGSTQPTMPPEPNAMGPSDPYNLNISSGGCHPFAGFKSWSVHEGVFEYS